MARKGKAHALQEIYCLVKNESDLEDPGHWKWYIQQVLTHGRSEDVARLDWEEITVFLGEISLPREVRGLWENYFNAER